MRVLLAVALLAASVPLAAADGCEAPSVQAVPCARTVFGEGSRTGVAAAVETAQAAWTLANGTAAGLPVVSAPAPADGAGPWSQAARVHVGRSFASAIEASETTAGWGIVESEAQAAFAVEAVSLGVDLAADVVDAALAAKEPFEDAAEDVVCDTFGCDDLPPL